MHFKRSCKHVHASASSEALARERSTIRFGSRNMLQQAQKPWQRTSAGTNSHSCALQDHEHSQALFVCVFPNVSFLKLVRFKVLLKTLSRNAKKKIRTYNSRIATKENEENTTTTDHPKTKTKTDLQKPRKEGPTPKTPDREGTTTTKQSTGQRFCSSSNLNSQCRISH